MGVGVSQRLVETHTQHLSGSYAGEPDSQCQGHTLTHFGDARSYRIIEEATRAIPGTGSVAAVVKAHVPPAVTGPPAESVPDKVAVNCVLNAKAVDGVNVARRVVASYVVVPAICPDEDSSVSCTLEDVTGFENTPVTFVATETLDDDG